MKYDLIFEGGGAKGMVLVGAYEEFVRRGHTAGQLLGTLAGAITATLVAAGYTPAEILGRSTNVKMTKRSSPALWASWRPLRQPRSAPAPICCARSI